ncbi:MAG: hypothetical protein AB8F74_23050 [Saprospiraceae bacterium]
MKKHAEKLWLGTMVFLLGMFLVALYGKVNIDQKIVSIEKTEKKSNLSFRLQEGEILDFTSLETTTAHPGTANLTATLD